MDHADMVRTLLFSNLLSHKLRCIEDCGRQHGCAHAPVCAGEAHVRVDPMKHCLSFVAWILVASVVVSCVGSPQPQPTDEALPEAAEEAAPSEQSAVQEESPAEDPMIIRLDPDAELDLWAGLRDTSDDPAR